MVVPSHVPRNEAPVPTHFFVILTSCGNSTLSPVGCEGPLQATSFILPHRPDHTESCAVSPRRRSVVVVVPSLYRRLCSSPSLQTGADLTWVEDWMRFHSARVRDIELLTGLSFYLDRLSVEETLQLKTFIQTL